MFMNTMLYSYFVLVNGITFLVFAFDKQKAKKRKWRIPTETLMGLSFVGGAAGGLLAMHMFHHKTRQKKFSVGLPAILITQMTLLLFWYNRA